MMLSFECSLAVYEKQKCYMHRSAKYPTQLYYLLLHIKVQLSTHTHTHNKKAYRGSRCTVPLILNSGTGWRSIGNLPILPIYTFPSSQGNNPHCPVNKMLGRPQRSSECLEETVTSTYQDSKSKLPSPSDTKPDKNVLRLNSYIISINIFTHNQHTL